MIVFDQETKKPFQNCTTWSQDDLALLVLDIINRKWITENEKVTKRCWEDFKAISLGIENIKFVLLIRYYW